MILHWPQITYAGLILFGMGVSCARYGQPKKDTYDFIDILVAPAICAAILYFGGFWTGGISP